MKNKILSQKGIKTTSQREAILNIVKEANEPITIKQIQEKCKEKIEIDLSTIYRILDLFVDNNIFTKILDYDGDTYYEFKTQYHKHYIKCLKCNEKQVIDYCPLDDTLEKILKNTGYTMVEHSLQLQGMCKKCSQVEVM
jgi:Fur family ferric uptake transcriptional regulator